MTLRLIDTVIHDLSGDQILYSLLRYLAQSRTAPVTLLARRGAGEAMIQKVRTALSKARLALKKTDNPIMFFGFSTEGPIRFKINGIDYDVYAIQFHATGLQRMRNLTLTKMKDLIL